MLLKHIYISCNDISSSALFYIELLELDVYFATETRIELSDGIVLCTPDEYRTLSESHMSNTGLVLEFEVQSFDKFLYKLYKIEYRIEYTIFIHDNKRTIKVLDPDRNTILIKEADDNSAKLSYGDKYSSKTIHGYSKTMIFDSEQ